MNNCLPMVPYMLSSATFALVILSRSVVMRVGYVPFRKSYPCMVFFIKILSSVKTPLCHMDFMGTLFGFLVFVHVLMSQNLKGGSLSYFLFECWEKISKPSSVICSGFIYHHHISSHDKCRTLKFDVRITAAK